MSSNNVIIHPESILMFQVALAPSAPGKLGDSSKAQESLDDLDKRLAKLQSS